MIFSSKLKLPFIRLISRRSVYQLLIFVAFLLFIVFAKKWLMPEDRAFYQQYTVAAKEANRNIRAKLCKDSICSNAGWVFVHGIHNGMHVEIIGLDDVELINTTTSAFLKTFEENKSMKQAIIVIKGNDNENNLTVLDQIDLRRK